MITKERAEEICTEMYQKVFDFCFAASKSNYHDALEITQEVFLVFSQKSSVLEDNQIDRWLISVAKKKAMEYYSRLKNDAMLISLEDSFTSAEDVLSTLTKFYRISDADIKMTIEAIIKMLTKEEYELFVKKFIEQKSQAEIAREMGVSVSNISTKTARLRNKIEKLGFFCFTFLGQIIIKNLF